MGRQGKGPERAVKWRRCPASGVGVGRVEEWPTLAGAPEAKWPNMRTKRRKQELHDRSQASLKQGLDGVCGEARVRTETEGESGVLVLSWALTLGNLWTVAHQVFLSKIRILRHIRLLQGSSQSMGQSQVSLHCRWIPTSLSHQGSTQGKVNSQEDRERRAGDAQTLA